MLAQRRGMSANRNAKALFAACARGKGRSANGRQFAHSGAARAAPMPFGMACAGAGRAGPRAGRPSMHARRAGVAKRVRGGPQAGVHAPARDVGRIQAAGAAGEDKRMARRPKG
ncbi:hypothetical protein [Cupriavidus basilensis]|uniref:hypothetical protein n=1 Tax=Cupriavidus basilensis TaxID=68895 RepID=UPI000B12A574|nr:hypothetical protein [Cupriavidus basilensis]